MGVTSLFCCITVLLLNAVSCVKVDVEKTKIWGPGLNENANLPVRYFFIQAKDKKGNE